MGEIGESILELDNNVGAVMDLLKELEIDEDTLDAVFHRMGPLLYHKFENMVIGRNPFIAQETSIIRKLFFLKKGQNRRLKFDNQKYISLIILRFINN